jgi:hypothetical protein
MKWRAAEIAMGLVVVLLLPGVLIGTAGATALTPSPTGPAPMAELASVVAPTVVTGPLAGDAVVASTTPSAAVTIADPSTFEYLPTGFWGLNVPATQAFKTSDASGIANSPVTYLRFPGGDIAEEYNYTTAVLTSDSGSTSTARTTTAQFVTSCESMGCHAIMELPAEINNSATAAYYAHYVVHTLNFQPAYWEIGNAVPGWDHFDQPWSQWGGAQRTHVVTPSSFAAEVLQYVAAVKKVDGQAKFIVFGSAMGEPDYAKAWISEIAAVDGHKISGISVHSYVMGNAPSNPTWSDLLNNLNGQYSMPDQVNADRGYMNTNCPGCGLKLFISEANAAEVNNYTKILPTFVGELYIAADVVYGLNLRVSNIDWFCYSSHYGGAWINGHTQQMQYTLFTQMFPYLDRATLHTTFSGPASFYAAATYSHNSGLALLLVNTNTSSKVAVNLAATGIVAGTTGKLHQWVSGATGPSNSSQTMGTTLTLPAESITILTIGLSGLAKSAHPSSGPHTEKPTAIGTSAPTSNGAGASGHAPLGGPNSGTAPAPGIPQPTGWPAPPTPPHEATRRMAR